MNNVVFDANNKENNIYIYEHKDWPNFFWNNDIIVNPLAEVRNLQGKLIGIMESLGFDNQEESNINNLIADVVNTSDIEGEKINPKIVRSSIAKKLGLNYKGLPPSDRNTDGIVDLMLDATENHHLDLTKTRLFKWHSNLFPDNYSGIYEIKTGNWRDDSSGEMQVVSGVFGKENIHFQAIKTENIEEEMMLFIKWFNTNNDHDLIIKAAVAHLWFLTIHPFDDGNGRIARAITDMLLAGSDGSNIRFYSMSTQINKLRNEYYEILENTQKGDLNITNWILWFLKCLKLSLINSHEIYIKTIEKNRFWLNYSKIEFNSRQIKIINLLLEDFKGKLTTTKWAKIAKCSKDTALRDINYLILNNILIKSDTGGRSTEYLLNDYSFPPKISRNS